MIKSKMLSDLDKKLESGYLLFYGYSHSHIPDQIKKNYSSRIKFFFKHSGQANKIIEKVKTTHYSGYKDTGWESSDVVFFDQDSVKSLLIGYPANAKYVLVNCLNFRYIHWILIGFLRRIIIQQVHFLGFKKLKHEQGFSFWLVLGREQLKNNNNFYLSREVGIEGFLKFLHSSSIDYVIPRHFESLPNLHREGGDLDLIVSDECELAVKEFLLKNEGDIRVDIWSVSGPNYHGITYMPPHIAQDVIDNSIEGNALSKIPSRLHTLNSMIFHVLYHKGFQSGVPSAHNTNISNIENTNDYLSLIKEYANQLGLSMDWDMESMDLYMLKIEWRPAIDTLAKIAQWNEWVRVHHFTKEINSELGIFALILKAQGVELGFEHIINTEAKLFGYSIISSSLLDAEVKRDAINKIRGGVWNDGLMSNDEVSKYYPEQIFLLLDQSRRGESGMRQFKNLLRKKIDKTSTSLIHTTDNDIETWDYIKICLPGQEAYLKTEIDALMKKKKKSFLTLNNIQSIQYAISSMKTKIKSVLIDILSH